MTARATKGAPSTDAQEYLRFTFEPARRMRDMDPKRNLSCRIRRRDAALGCCMSANMNRGTWHQGEKR